MKKDHKMKQFFKEHSYTIVRLLVFQLAADILGFITSSAAQWMTAAWVFPAVSIFCTLFYLFVIAAVCYEYGQKDGIRIESGKIKLQPLKFFLIGLIANSLNLLLGIVTVFGRLIIGAPMSGMLEGEFSPVWLANLQEITATIARFLQTMYLGIVQTVSDRNVIMLVIIPLPAILTAGISYLVGIRFKDGMFQKKEKENKTERYS